MNLGAGDTIRSVATYEFPGEGSVSDCGARAAWGRARPAPCGGLVDVRMVRTSVWLWSRRHR